MSCNGTRAGTSDWLHWPHVDTAMHARMSLPALVGDSVVPRISIFPSGAAFLGPIMFVQSSSCLGPVTPSYKSSTKAPGGVVQVAPGTPAGPGPTGVHVTGAPEADMPASTGCPVLRASGGPSENVRSGSSWETSHPGLPLHFIWEISAQRGLAVLPGLGCPETPLHPIPQESRSQGHVCPPTTGKG